MNRIPNAQRIVYLINDVGPGQCDSVGWASSGALKGCLLDSNQGTCLDYQLYPQVCVCGGGKRGVGVHARRS